MNFLPRSLRNGHESPRPLPNPFSGRYLLFGEIGRGRCASVHFALDIDSRSNVALKIGDRSAFHRIIFGNESQALGRLSHPNIVRVFHGGIYCGLPFIAMEHVPGDNLQEQMELSVMRLRDRLSVAAGICSALEAVHAAGMVHRDVKPKNVVVSKKDGRALLLDFGFALVDGKEPLHLKRIANPLYAAPEQKKDSGTCDSRADIYSAGMLLYHLLIWSPAPLIDFLRIAAVRSGCFPVLCRAGMDSEADAFRIVKKAVEKDPDKRFQSASEMRKAIERIMHATDF